MLKKPVLLAILLIVVSPLLAVGEVTYIGSSTIGENIIPEAAQAFTVKTGIKFGTIENPGSGKGIEAVIKGEAELAGASRPLEANEKNLKLYYQIIGYDVIGVYVHKNNPVKNLTKEELKKIFTGNIKNWKEVGGNDAPIMCITETLGEKRATMLEFQKLAMDGASYLEDRTEVDEPKDQVTALVKEENGIISVSISFVWSQEIKLVAINNIFPETKSVRSGAYLISRPLLLVTKGLPKGDIKKFIDFMISEDGQKIVGKKFVSVR